MLNLRCFKCIINKIQKFIIRYIEKKLKTNSTNNITSTKNVHIAKALLHENKKK